MTLLIWIFCFRVWAGELPYELQKVDSKMPIFGLGQAGYSIPQLDQERKMTIGHLILMSKSPDAATRAEAIEALGKWGATEAHDRIRELFGDPSPLVRTAAISSLGPTFSKDHDLKPKLSKDDYRVMEGLCSDPSLPIDQKMALAKLISSTSDGRFRPCLLALLKQKNQSHELNVWTLRAIAKGLGEVDFIVDLEKVLPPFLNSEYIREVLAAITILEKIGEAGLFDKELRKRMMTHSNPYVRVAWAKAAVHDPQFPQIELEEMLSDSDPMVRMAAICERVWQKRDLQNRMLSMALESKSPVARLLLSWTFEAMDYLTGQKTILDLTKDLDPSVRNSAILALGKMNSHESFGRLRELIFSDQVFERGVALSALLSRDDPQKTKLAAEAYRLSQGERWVEIRSLALDILSEDSSQQSIELLKKGLDDPWPELRLETYRHLTMRGVEVPRPEIKARDQSPPLPRAGAKKQLVILTNKGTLKWDLLSDLAPEHVLTLTERVNKGFYNGSEFYGGMQTDFLQFGDSTKSGWGGVDGGRLLYSRRVKFPVQRGNLMAEPLKVLGMDSPRLVLVLGDLAFREGRMTPLGRLVQGHQILDNLVLGDRVISARVVDR